MPLPTSKANYTSLLSGTQRSAVFYDRLRRIGIVLIVVAFGLLTLAAIFLIEDFRTKGSVNDSINDSVNDSVNDKSGETVMFVDGDARHDRFMFPDWRLGLGWNNVRYALEHHTYYAHVLNRTLIIPEEIHLRKCYQEALCSFIGRRIKDAAWDMDGGKDHWAIPIKHFIDLPHLKSKVKVLTVTEFFALQLRRAEAQRNAALANTLRRLLASPDRLDAHVEDGSYYATTLPNVTLVKTTMNNFLHEQPGGIVVVDDLAPVERLFPKKNTTQARNTTLYSFVDLPNMSLDTIYTANATIMPPAFWDDPKAAVLYPYFGIPRKRVNQGSRFWDEDAYNPPKSHIALKGFLQTWTAPPYDTATLFHFQGDPHRFGFQPMKFTTSAGSELYQQIAFDWLRHAGPVEAAADFAWSRLMRLVGDNPILSFHLRRGDFSQLGWNGLVSNPEKSAVAVKKAYADLSERFREQQQQLLLQKPDGVAEELSARFFLSTDDTTRDGVIPLYAAGAVRLMDLLSVNLTHEASELDEIDAFWDENMHVAAFGDWLGLVEQSLCSRAWFFVGTHMSSFTGGILNLRARAGHTVSESSFIDLGT